MKISVERFEIESNKLKKDYILCLLSDIHITKYTNYKLYENLVESIKKEKPDYILIPGDMFYTSDDLLIDRVVKKMDYLLKNLYRIAQTFLCYGNHDLKDGKKSNHKLIDKYFKNIEEKSKGRFKLLNNKVININDINIIGITPVFDMYYYNYKNKWIKLFIDALSKIDKYNLNKFNIILTHNPEIISKLKKNINK